MVFDHCMPFIQGWGRSVGVYLERLRMCLPSATVALKHFALQACDRLVHDGFMCKHFEMRPLG